MNFDDQKNPFIEEDYYACFNVSKEATQEEITSAYRRLSRLYHPDKQTDVEQKKKAELLFSKMKKAYEVLSDPHQRAIYDTIGIKGLVTDGWEIVQRTKTPQEITEEYERLAREKNERRLQQRTNAKGSLTVNINATDIFNKYDDAYDYVDKSFFPSIEISAMSISQSIEAPLTLRDTLTLTGSLATQNGNGTGAFSVSCKRLLMSNNSIEGELSVGEGGFSSRSGSVASIRYYRSITQTIFATFGTHLRFKSSGIKLGFSTNLAMPMDRHTMGYLTWNIGLNPSMNTILVRDTEDSNLHLVCSLSTTNSYISASHTWKINKEDLKLKVFGKIGTLQTIMDCSIVKKVSEQSVMSAAVSIGVPSGIILKVRISRAYQSYYFPIHLYEEPRLVPSVYAVITPFVVWFTVKKLIVEPFMKEQKEKEIEKIREIYKKKMEEKRREANATVDLMKTAYERIRSEEEHCNGLIIVRALYGKNADIVTKNNETSQFAEVIDVTLPLQCLVKNSQLWLHGSSKSQLSGFYDPCVGEDKILFVKYLFHSHLSEVSIKDKEVLRIPKQCSY